MAPISLPSGVKDPSTHLINLTQRLLVAISKGDWETYVSLVPASNTLTCFEPEAGVHLVRGLPFHKTYFDLAQRATSPPFVTTTLVNPVVTILDKAGSVALVTYVRLVQRVDKEGSPYTTETSETRVWVRDEQDWEKWVNVHFHRSVAKL
ncbi:Calcium/calmodulin-dependent protein kinase II, association-domain-containing protein [Chytridium lagenaria]|nr:Calcium/calmodulin-dependent protein kinase II, association-domain-containing protein [Chytridium lagenaria]